jgi:hypothetical protein
MTSCIAVYLCRIFKGYGMNITSTYKKSLMRPFALQKPPPQPHPQPSSQQSKVYPTINHRVTSKKSSVIYTIRHILPHFLQYHKTLLCKNQDSFPTLCREHSVSLSQPGFLTLTPLENLLCTPRNAGLGLAKIIPKKYKKF